MTAVTKASQTANTSALVDGQTIDAADVSTPIGDLLALLKNGRLSVSATDTYLKHLQDAISVDGTALAAALLGGGGNEQLQITLNAKLVALIAFLSVAGKVGVGGLDSGAAPNGYVATANGSGGVSYAPAAGGGAAPIDITVAAGEDLALRDLAYVNPADGKAYKIDTNSNPIRMSAVRGIVNHAGGIANNTTGTLRISGAVSGFTGLTAWADVWAATTPGGYTQTRPTLTAGGGQIAMCKIGYAVSTTDVMVWQAPVQFQRRESLANAGQTTVLHYPDPLARLRWCSAYASINAPGNNLTSYDQSNQDTAVQLRGTNYTGSTTSNATGGAANSIGDSSTNLRWRAQAFQLTAGGPLSQIKVTLLANTGSPSGTLTWEIRSGANPTGTLLATGTFTPTPSAENTINVANGPILEASTTYFLVLRPTVAQNAGSAWNWSVSAANPYAGGNEWQSSNSGSSWTEDAGYDNVFSITTSAVSAKDKISQSFQVTGTQTVDQVQLWLKKTGSPTGTLTLRIETDNAGNPSGTLVDANASVTVAESSLNPSYNLVVFDFGTNFSISGSTTYHLVLSTDRAASNSNYVEWGADGSSPGYANGQMLSQVSPTWSAEGKDACFYVYAQGTTFEAPRTVDAWDSALAAILTRFDDGAGANGDSQTTFKNNIGITSDVTLVVELP